MVAPGGPLTGSRVEATDPDILPSAARHQRAGSAATPVCSMIRRQHSLPIIKRHRFLCRCPGLRVSLHISRGRLRSAMASYENVETKGELAEPPLTTLCMLCLQRIPCMIQT